METTDVREVARRFIRAWDADGREVVGELAAPGFHVDYPHFPEPIQGAEAFEQMLARTHRFFPDLRIDVEGVIAEGDRAAVHWTYRGTFREGVMFGVPAADQPVEVTGVTIYRVENGKVVNERGVVDNLGLMMQLGAVPSAPDSTSERTEES